MSFDISKSNFQVHVLDEHWADITPNLIKKEVYTLSIKEGGESITAECRVKSVKCLVCREQVSRDKRQVARAKWQGTRRGKERNKA